MRSSRRRGSTDDDYRPHGQMVINLKTTVTTSSSKHNGLVVKSAIHSPSTSHSNGQPNQWKSFIESPSTSYYPREQEQDMLRPAKSLQDMKQGNYEDRSSRIRWDHYPSSYYRDRSTSPVPLPINMVPSTSRESIYSERRSIGHRDPSPPSSPIYSFNGRNSPPDEFIQPTKLVLNVFRTPKRDERSFQANEGISLVQRNNAPRNDAVTTSTTVEVFRAPMDTPVVALPPSPYGNQPLLIRTHGPGYEQWSNQRTQTSVDDGPKSVQWKDGLVDSRFANDGYAEIQNYPASNQRQFTPMSHPILSNSRDDLSRPPPYPSYYSETPKGATSPLYIIPDRYARTTHDSNPDRYEMPSRSRGRRSRSTDNDDRQRSTNGMRYRSISPMQRSSNGGSQDDEMNCLMDEFEMMCTPLVESEDSLISETSNRHDVARSSMLEMKPNRVDVGKLARQLSFACGNREDDEIDEIYARPPRPPVKDYTRLPKYRKNEDRTEVDSISRKGARRLVDKKLAKNCDAVYATPKKKKTNKKQKQETTIEEFKEELPKYVKRQENATPTLDMKSEQPFDTSEKIRKVEQRLNALRLAREDSLTSLLKKELSKRNEEKKEKNGSKLPEYVEPKDPIKKELQEFLQITAKDHNRDMAYMDDAASEEEVKSNENKDEEILKRNNVISKKESDTTLTPSTSAPSSTSSTIV